MGFPEFRHNQWTFEGEIERLAAFARGSHRAGGWRRKLAILVAVAILTPMAIGGVVYVVTLLAR